MQADFENVLETCRDGDFIFLDPPYKPGEKELKEAHYSHGKFSFNEQIRLSKTIKSLTHRKKKIKWLMTNSAAPEIRALYQGFSITEIPKGTGERVGIYDGDSKEILIRNY
jgi:DNA adenine methylase